MNDNREKKYAEILSKMIQKETVSQVGQTDRTKFREFHSLLRELFPNIFNACEFEDFDGSILMRWPGKNKDAMPVMFMNHHDVVAVSGEWTHPAFSGAIADGKVWGRGSLDTKGGLFGMLQAADELVADGFVPSQDIYFESDCTEELDGLGADTISKELVNRGLRFAYVLDEGGMIVDEPVNGAKGVYGMIGMGEKGTAEILLKAKGHGGHSSTPSKDTPLARLGKFMAYVDDNNIFDVELSPVIREMFRRVSKDVNGPLKHVYAHPDFFAGVLKKVMPKTSPTAKALLQTTIAFTMAKGSDARNAIPTEASVIASMRVSHHQGYEKSLAAVTECAKKYDIETEVLMPAIESGMSDYNSDGFKRIEAALNSAFPGIPAVPYIQTGMSDARYMSRVSDNCFRFVPFLINHAQMDSIHGIDENVDVSTLPPAVDFYKYMMSH